MITRYTPNHSVNYHLRVLVGTQQNQNIPSQSPQKSKHVGFLLQHSEKNSNPLGVRTPEKMLPTSVNFLVHLRSNPHQSVCSAQHTDELPLHFHQPSAGLHPPQDHRRASGLGGGVRWRHTASRSLSPRQGPVSLFIVSFCSY